MTKLTFRAAAPRDAADLAALVDIASHGRNAGLWQKAIDEGQSTSIFEIGRRMVLIPDHDLSYQKATIALIDDTIIGGLFGEARPADYQSTLAIDSFAADLRDEQALKAQTGGTWYLGIAAVYREFQGRGYGTQLMKEAAKQARTAKQRKMTVIVAQSNQPAFNLYLKSGFRVIDRRPVAAPEQPAGGLVLMRRVLNP